MPYLLNSLWYWSSFLNYSTGLQWELPNKRTFKHGIGPEWMVGWYCSGWKLVGGWLVVCGGAGVWKTDYVRDRERMAKAPWFGKTFPFPTTPHTRVDDVKDLCRSLLWFYLQNGTAGPFPLISPIRRGIQLFYKNSNAHHRKWHSRTMTVDFPLFDFQLQ